MNKQLNIFETAEPDNTEYVVNVNNYKKIYSLDKCILCNEIPVIKSTLNDQYHFIKCPKCGFSCGSYYDDYIHHWNYCNKYCRK